MSGGSMNYLFSRLEQGADFDQDTPERVAFAKHLELVCKALHDIEWVDSSDYGPGDENAAIMACVGEAEKLREALRALCDSHRRFSGGPWDAARNLLAE